MKCLKVEEYIKRTCSPDDIDCLYGELEDYVKTGPGPDGRTLCDRVIRACNHQLGTGTLGSLHLSKLVLLVELALRGYESVGELGAQSSPLYMEKIIFHIMKKLATHGAHHPCQRIASLLYDRLTQVFQMEDYRVLVRSCFAVLWSGLTRAQENAEMPPRDKLCCHLQALSFLLLLDKASDGSTSPSKVPSYAGEALSEFGKGCGTMTEDDASFLLQETRRFLFCPEGSGSWHALCEVLLHICKLLCRAGHWGHALDHVKEAGRCHKESPCLRSFLDLTRRAVDIHRSLSNGEECARPLIKCARALRSLPSSQSDQDCHLVLQACQFITWAFELSQGKKVDGTSLLAWFSFSEEYQELLQKHLYKGRILQQEQKRFFQQVLCGSMCQGLLNAYDSLVSTQLEDSETLKRVLLYCKATTGQMMSELQKLASDSFFIKAATAVNSLVCALYNRRLYDEAFSLVEILCHELTKNKHPSLPVEKLNRAFLLAVQSSRRGAHLDRALDWVVHWLHALGDQVTEYMAEPVSLWVKTKADAARAGQEDTRLRTLHDGFGTNLPEEAVMLCLLEAELGAYREVAGDTAQERYNTLCDLLEICREDGAHPHRRAVYLCEMAQVVCFQDFSEQTDCSAVDFTQESLRLLDEEPETEENCDRIQDDKAQASLWLYICTLEKNLQEAMEVDKRLRDAREQERQCVEPAGTNDLDYEDKGKQLDSQLIYDGLRFNLMAESQRQQPLDRALALWKSLMVRETMPAVRSAKQTVSSIVLMAALYKLMGKPLQALEGYQLAVGLSRRIPDSRSCTSALCESARLLLEMGAPDMARLQLEQVEVWLQPDSSPEELSPLDMLATLLRAELCYSTKQVDIGISHLCLVLKEVAEHKHSKSWYLLRAKALQTASAYLSLDATVLPHHLRKSITEHGLKTPDTTLYESLKLLCSLVVTLVGNGFYGAHSTVPDTRFVDQGDNVLLKWQLLSEVLSCSLRMVTVRSQSGAVQEAKVQCLEALKLATKLQTLSRCAELLVVKAELELLKGESEVCSLDLEQVKYLLDVCTDFSSEEKTVVKINPRKGRPAKKPSPNQPVEDDDYSGILCTRSFPREAVHVAKEWSLAASPQLKPRKQEWLASLGHKTDCGCPCCTDPGLGRVCARWTATQAELAHRLQRKASGGRSRKLFLAALSRCRSVTAKLGTELARLLSAKGKPSPSFLHDLVGRLYLRMSYSCLDLRLEKNASIWDFLDSGFAFISSSSSFELEHLHASLQATKALASVLALAAQKNCRPEELFSAFWAWNPPAKLEHKPQPHPSTKATKDPEGSSKAQEGDEDKDPEISSSQEIKNKKGTGVSLVVPKVKITFPSTKNKSLASKTPLLTKTPKSKSTSLGEPCVFDFSNEVPQIAVKPHSPTHACTPVQKVKQATTARRCATKPALKMQFQVYDESSPAQDKLRPVPAAPKRSKRSRFKVEFSDESDAEPSDVPENSEKRGAGKMSSRSKSTASFDSKRVPPVEKVLLKKQGKAKKSTALPTTCSSSDESASTLNAPRRGRSKNHNGLTAKPVTRDKSKNAEPEKMRTIEEDKDLLMDMSVEELRTSDTEELKGSGRIQDFPGADFEVLRRDLGADREGGFFSELRSGDVSWSQQFHGTFPNTGPDGLSLELVQCLLRSALLSLQHFPPSWLYPQICGLLAVCHGQCDPVATAMLHSQSFGVTARHHMTRHLATRLTKLKKASAPDLTEKLEALSLDDRTTQTQLQKRLTHLERIFSFPVVEPSAFPHQNCQDFTQQLKNIPVGVTVCLLSVVGVHPGEIGDTVLLSRLEGNASPVTVRIPTSQRECSISAVIQEMDDVQKRQKEVSSVADKAQWWDGRRALDNRMERMLEEMREILGCWQGLLLPLSSDPELSCQTKNLHQALAQCGVQTTETLLKAVLSASPFLSCQDLRSLAGGLCPGRPEQALVHLQTAVSSLKDRVEPQGHVVLILDKHLQKLPWENISCLKPSSVTRMPSLQFLLGHCALRELDPKSVLNRGVDPQQVFYVVNPDANLKDTEERFKEWFTNEATWQGVCGVAPSPEQLQEAVTTKDLYIYVGHGAGARFLDGQRVLKDELRAASLLFGCSSAALAVHGDLDGSGIILNYLMAGCPLILGNLWDVTDRDIDRFTKALLQSWLSAGRGAALLDHMASSRQATHLRYLIGAAPVVYGMPIFLK